MPVQSPQVKQFFSRSFAAAALALITSADAVAQGAMSGVPNAMQGFSQNRDQPIQIEAASLEMRDKKKEATFSGNLWQCEGRARRHHHDLENAGGVLRCRSN